MRTFVLLSRCGRETVITNGENRLLVTADHRRRWSVPRNNGLPPARPDAWEEITLVRHCAKLLCQIVDHVLVDFKGFTDVDERWVADFAEVVPAEKVTYIFCECTSGIPAFLAKTAHAKAQTFQARCEGSACYSTKFMETGDLADLVLD